jgi:hypothetical protein
VICICRCYLQAGRKTAVINAKLGQVSERSQCPVVPHCYPEPDSALQHNVRLYPSCIFKATCRSAAGNNNANHCSLQWSCAPQHEATMERSRGLKLT